MLATCLVAIGAATAKRRAEHLAECLQRLLEVPAQSFERGAPLRAGGDVAVGVGAEIANERRVDCANEQV